MKEFTVTRNDAGQRLDRFAAKQAPSVPAAALQKHFRTKDVKLNGHWARPDVRVAEGDVVRLYLPDRYFAAPPSAARAELDRVPAALDLVYEDENILLVNKRPGVLCHAAQGWSPDTLVARIQAHVYRQGQWDPAQENSFAPALCNRIDRGTGGIVAAAKNAAALRAMDELIRQRQLDKYYLCVCLGRPQPPEGLLDGYLFKDAVKNTVYLRARPEPGASRAMTEYRLLQAKDGLALVRCRLLTGRTHQIRVQMAGAGWPLLGDGKYGDGRANRRFGEQRQLLWSYRLDFPDPMPPGILDYLAGKSFQVPQVPFVEKYFN